MSRQEKLLQLPNVRESIFYEKLAHGTVQCKLCERRCRISPGDKGFCKTRMNKDGKLYTLVYGYLSALESRPIEIKPFFHYWPGSTALTFSTWSCNFDCVWCQNWSLSKTTPDVLNPVYYSPTEIVNLAIKKGDKGLCSSFQEPTLLTDWNIDLFQLGRTQGFYACYVSNGYMTLEALELLWKSGMDGLKIDVKGEDEVYKKFCGEIDVDKIWRNIREAKKIGYHVEIVNLVVTGVNDDAESLRQLIERHLKEAGSDVPLHFTRYYPAYKFTNPPTKVETLEKAYEMAKKLGVKYPYIGNVQRHKYENTYCPNCQETLIKRYGFKIIRYNVTKDKRCPKCGCLIPIKGQNVRNKSGLY